jgi:dephospho-CoA kinase
MILVGLTGSIGMGKTTTARLFAEEGAAVHDSDAAVHDLYAAGGAAVAAVDALFPGVVQAGAVDRRRLAERVVNDPQAKRLEAAIHPLVAAHRDDFLAGARAAGAKIVVLDIPLLFETGADRLVDKVVVVSAPLSVQRDRVMARPGMTEAKFAAILARQTPDAEKRARADFVIDTGSGIEAARAQVRDVLKALDDSSLS